MMQYPQVSTLLSHMKSLTGHNGFDNWHTLSLEPSFLNKLANKF